MTSTTDDTPTTTNADTPPITPGAANDVGRIEFGTLAEQEDEAFYDDRSDADDDVNKGRIKFPRGKLFGRDAELQQLAGIYASMTGGGGVNEDNNNNASSTTSISTDRRVVWLAGYSGTGKSALVSEFVRRQNPTSDNDDDAVNQASSSSGLGDVMESNLGESSLRQNYNSHNRLLTNRKPIYCGGKFGQLKAGDPFSAIGQAMEACFQTELLPLLPEEKTKTNDPSQPQSLQQLSDEIKALKKRLAYAGIYAGSDATQVLADTIMPTLPEFLARASTSSSNGASLASSNGNGNSKSAADGEANNSNSIGHDMNVIQFAFVNWIKALASAQRPVIFFLDDLQWADGASLQLLSALLKDKGVKHVLFIGAYRNNEVEQNQPANQNNQPEENDNGEATTETPELHPFAKVMTEVETSIGETYPPLVHKMQISNLSPDSVGAFIAETLDRPDLDQDINEITSAVYAKTLGNIFFVQVALEELVRKNAIYYDVISFAWQCSNVTRVELQDCLSDDVVEMVQSKLQTLPKVLQTMLAVTAYTKNTFEIDLIPALLKSQQMEVSRKVLAKLLKRAFREGIVLYDTSLSSSSKSENGDGSESHHGSIYQSTENNNNNTSAQIKFAHDRIREAACNLIPQGEERHLFLLSIAKVLLARGSEGEDDWMLFAAARHMNSIPSEMTDPVELAELNLRVGKIAVVKGSFGDSVGFFRSGVACLGESSWEEHYDLTLALHNFLMESESFLGNKDKAAEAVETVIQKAKSLPDKLRAHYVKIDASQSNQDYGAAVKIGAEILSLYDIDIPYDATDKQVKREKFQLNVALRGRSLMCFSKFAIAGDDDEISGPLRISQVVSKNATFGKMTNVVSFLSYRTLRLCLSKKLVTKHVPYLLLSLSSPLRQNEQYEKASLYANIALSLMDRFPKEKSKEFLMSKQALYGSLICLRISFRDAIESFFELNTNLLSVGASDMGMAAGMLSMYAFLNASLPLGSLLEPKLLLFQEMASNLGKKMFVVMFSLMRQFLYNLRGGTKAGSSPTCFDTETFNEEKVMSQFQGPPKNMNNRDIGIFRLWLAVVFDDDEEMEKMLERLDSYPVHDLPINRQHVRMTYMGFASNILLHKSDKHKKWADLCFDFFQKLDNFGSPNAGPVFACIKALRTPSVEAFNEAIQKVENMGLINLSALMNERCGLWLLEQAEQGKSVEPQGNAARKSLLCAVRGSSISHGMASTNHEEYLKNALWLYHDWGALSKVMKMQQRHACLATAIQEKPPSQLSSVRKMAQMLGAPRPGALTDSSA